METDRLTKIHGVDVRHNDYYIQPDLETIYETKENVVVEKNSDRLKSPVKYEYKSSLSSELKFRPMKGTDEYMRQI